jgi:hypothetical protein
LASAATSASISDLSIRSNVFWITMIASPATGHPALGPI